MEPEEIARFEPVETSDLQRAKIDTVRSSFKDLARVLVSQLPQGRTRALAFTKLEEASFFAVRSISEVE